MKSTGDPATNELNPTDIRVLDRHQARDLLLLAACYDQSTAETKKGRWNRLRRKLRYASWPAQWDLAFGSRRHAGHVWADGLSGQVELARIALDLPDCGGHLASLGLAVFAAISAGFGRGLRNVRVGKHAVGSLRRILMKFRAADLAGQPLPRKQRTDDRYELLAKFQGILRSLGFTGIIVLVDRVDEPHLINGSVEQMKTLLWPMLDNKFLKHPGIGFKLLLPIELSQYIDT